MATRCRHFCFMKINVNSVLKRAEEKKNEVKPLPKVTIGKVNRDVRKELQPDRKKAVPDIFDTALEKVSSEGSTHVDQQIRRTEDQDAILKNLWKEISDIKTQRGKLSSETAYLVTRICNRLLKESPGAAQAFMAGDLPDPELADHYRKIEELTDQAAVVWDNIEYVEKYGKMPERESVAKPLLQESTKDADVLKYEIRRLDDLVCKTKAKIKGKPPKNPSRLAMWNTKLAQAQDELKEKKQQLERLQYDARAKRTGTDES